MDSTAFTSHKVEDRSHIAFIKREMHGKVVQANFPTARVAEIDIIISELTSNLIKYGVSGELLYRVTQANDEPVFELICSDGGIGMSNVNHMMKDGISTSNTLGQGLGAIQRLSDVFQIYSLPKWGTVAYVRVGPLLSPVGHGLDAKLLSIPKAGESVCGDGGHVKKTKDGYQVFLGDGLGHGPHAHDAVQAAIRSFRICPETEPVQILRFIDKDVKKTRGLVGTVAVLDTNKKTWHICGIGNILTRVYEGLTFKNCLSYNGIIGLNIPNTMKEHVLPAENHQHLVMCSDGISTRWDFSRYPALLRCDPMIWNAVIYKDFSRGTDDASMLVGKLFL